MAFLDWARLKDQDGRDYVIHVVPAEKWVHSDLAWLYRSLSAMDSTPLVLMCDTPQMDESGEVFPCAGPAQLQIAVLRLCLPDVRWQELSLP